MMKRRLFKLGLWIVAGAIVNVAVAWGISQYEFAVTDDHQLNDSELKSVWQTSQNAGVPIPDFDVELLAGHRYNRFGLEEIGFDNTYSNLINYWNIYVLRYGFPMCSLQGIWTWDDPSATESRFDLLLPPFRQPQPGWSNCLPIRPIWPGFAINTVFYAAVLWVLFAGTGWIRRRVRIKRGLCPACAYPVGTSEVCTECGYDFCGSNSGGASAPNAV
jgi:hypothetical protein